jgi:4-hydroxy-L-threonine phosphate dehydrogenase PdxA
VAHGTAFDLAWQGRAEPGSMIEAVRLAAQLANARLAAAARESKPIPGAMKA